MLCIKLVSIMSASGLQHAGSSEHRHGARADRGSTAPHLRSEPYERLARPALVTVMNGTWCHGIVVRHSVLLCNSVVSVMFYCVCTLTAINFCAPTEGTARFRNFGLNLYIDDCCEKDTKEDARYSRLILLCMLATGAFCALELLH